MAVAGGRSERRRDVTQAHIGIEVQRIANLELPTQAAQTKVS